MKYECILEYKHNPNCIIPNGSICESEGYENNAYMIYIIYRKRYMLVNLATLRKHFKEMK